MKVTQHFKQLKKVARLVANTRPSPSRKHIQECVQTLSQTIAALTHAMNMNPTASELRDCDKLPVKLTAQEANHYWWAHSEYLGNVRKDNARARKWAWRQVCKNCPRLLGKEKLL